jgi:hypothetical protein
VSSRPGDRSISALPPRVAYLFAPIDKRALGLAVGAVAGFAVALLTAGALLVQPARLLPLSLLVHYFPGYQVSWPGMLVGLTWAFVVGFCGGWLVAFTRNLVIAGWLFLTRSREELVTARDFLDHI